MPRYRTARLQQCIKYQGVKIWNNNQIELKISLLITSNVITKTVYCINISLFYFFYNRFPTCCHIL